MLKLSITANPKVPRRLSKAAVKLSPNLSVAIEDVGKILVKEMKRNVSGKVLNKRSGALFNSIDAEVRTRKGSYSVSIIPDVPYAAIHEKGGRTGRGHKTRIPKRSYMKKALDDKRNEVIKIIRRFTSKAFR